MRGAVQRLVGGIDVVGIIPACAGSRRLGSGTPRRTWGHPRVCGEQVALDLTDCTVSGSSPRVRGAALEKLLISGMPGIIPAYAGSSRSSRRSCGGTRDHPRAGGEQELPFAALVLLTGSSPRMRGAEHGSSSCASALGIIPARAGSRP